MVTSHIILPVALALALVLTGSIDRQAHAQVAPRRVAVVNAAADQDAGARLAESLRRALTFHAHLAPVPAGDLARALEAPLVPPHANPAALEEARATLEQARAAMARFAYDEALQALRRAEQRLLGLIPSEPVHALLARVVFERGRILLQRRDPGALQELALARRLDPSWDELDPSVYLPEVVQAFANAGDAGGAGADGAAAMPQATVEVTALFDGAAVYIDGRRAGRTPVRAHLVPGVHYVAGTFADHHVAGERVVLGQESRQVKLRFGRVTVDDRARNWRIGLVQAAPLTGIPRLRVTEIARSAAELSAADAVLLITDDRAGTLHIAIHDQEASTPSAWRPVVATSIDGLLASLAAARRDRGLVSGVAPAPRPEPGSLWSRPWVKAAVGTGIAASVLAIALRTLAAPGDQEVGAICCRVSSPGAGLAIPGP